MDRVSSKKTPGRPRTGVTPHRSVRVGPEWDQAHKLAQARGDKMSEIVTRALKEYVEQAMRQAGSWTTFL